MAYERGRTSKDSRTGNMYAELSPYQAQSSIRQYIRTTPGAPVQGAVEAYQFEQRVFGQDAGSNRGGWKRAAGEDDPCRVPERA